MRNLIILVAFAILQSCSLEPKIIITKDYINNKYWNNYNNAIHVEKLKLKKDSILDIFKPNFDSGGVNNWNVTNKLEIDSTFYFGYSGLNSKNDKKKMKGKISFINDNGFNWYSSKGSVDIIGKLQNNSWYKFSNLKSTPVYFYVYVDSEGNTHKFSEDLSNY